MDQLTYYLENKDKFIVKKHSEKDLYLIKYMHLGVDWDNKWTREARAIVLDANSNVIARPYEKFFNYKELENRDNLSKETIQLSEWPDEDYLVTEKLDGSLAVVFQYDNELMYASSGNLEGKYPRVFKKWIEANLTPLSMKALKEITKEYTLMFEYLSPDNQIVVEYPEEKMVLHGIIHTKSGKEVYEYDKIRSVAEALGVEVVKRYMITLEEMLDFQASNSTTRNSRTVETEGFVILFENGQRLKIKTQEYMDLHFVATIFMDNINTKSKVEYITGLILDNEVDDILAEANRRGADEASVFINQLIEFNNTFNDMKEKARKTNNIRDFTKKDYVLRFGDSSYQSILVLNYGKERFIKKLRYKYMEEKAKELRE